jgi:hypothetical protein
MPSGTTGNPTDLRRLRTAAPAAYLISLALLGPFLTPHIGIWDAGIPVGSLGWRFGFVGLVFSSLFYLLLALVLAATTAGYFGHRRTLLLVTLLSALACALLVLGLPLFALDTLQLRKILNPTVFVPYKVAALKGAALAAMGIPVLLLVTLGSHQAWRSLRGPRVAGERQGRTPLIRSA